MFIQIIEGRCTRHDELRAVLDRWPTELGPGAEGWLGGTYGFTDDDLFVAVVRFEDRAHAMANSQRPEQGRWAEEMMSLFAGPVEFHDCDDVTLLFDGGSDDAGFVQVIRGKVDDPARLRALMTSDPTELKRMRPEIIGATLAIEPDGTFTETVAFTDEASARRGETQEPPADVRAELAYVMEGATFHDLHRPWFTSH
ncbi:hypothetical protein [Nocardioides sp. YIM 152315]|uniref:hypothetical protein n=1 Tax=Nocardioides sp. YIM 152315 TaxID=3031760 RepID=UPI0023D9C926|nr:hypothetical protein [Nocardioides sp. YIM 152315]MDF1604338.1 hypothetical protein [Nocardioides sp. YIM 152315]